MVIIELIHSNYNSPIIARIVVIGVIARLFDAVGGRYDPFFINWGPGSNVYLGINTKCRSFRHKTTHFDTKMVILTQSLEYRHKKERYYTKLASSTQRSFRHKNVHLNTKIVILTKHRELRPKNEFDSCMTDFDSKIFISTHEKPWTKNELLGTKMAISTQKWSFWLEYCYQQNIYFST